MSEEVIKFLGGTAIALSAIAWLIRSLISHFLNKDVEGYKQRLDKKAFIHRTKFSALHEKQARILEELYSHLLEFISAAEYLVSPSLPPSAPSVQDRAISLDGYSGTFYRYYYKNRIYLSPDLCAKIDELFEAISDSTSRYTFWNAKEEQGRIQARSAIPQ